jgi:hypothetical protein
MKETSTIRFESVCEWEDTFLSLFPHRFDYIWARHPDLDAPVEWKTESRHPLSDRLIRQGAYLYGVRFGAETNYCLLDIDTGSLYHPKRDPLAVSRIVAALEPLGLVKYVACTSSYSGGLHLYFPFQQVQSSWQLAIALACLLENAGFKLQPGQLEVFPNPKPYAADGNLSLFNAHRLPLQIGSYLLNEAWQPIWTDSQIFVSQWVFAQQHNDINEKTLKQILKQAKRKHFGISGKAEKFINDLNAEIELGWTGHGQTNRLLGRITMRAYIFHHVLSGGEPLRGEALVSEIVETAQSLPGYQEWCRHQCEIEQRAEEWARCIENSHYFHFGDQSKKVSTTLHNPELVSAVDQSPSWNQRQSAATRDRIRRAIADLLEQNSLPVKATARFQTLLQYGIGGASLYRHRDLWHPTYSDVSCFDINYSDRSLIENESLHVPSMENPATIKTDSQLDCVSHASNWLSPSSLLSIDGGNSRPSQGLGDRIVSSAPSDGSNGDTNVDNPTSTNFAPSSTTSDSPSGVQYIQQALSNIKVVQAAFQETACLAQVQHQRLKAEAAEQRHIARMQQFLDSGDPILVAEAMVWARANPGVLKLK